MKGILPLINRGSGCDYHRIILPLKYMGVDLDFFENKTIGEVLEDTKIILFNRRPHARLDYFLSLREKYGIKIVVDIDDYWILHPKHYMYKSWEKSKMPEQIVLSLKIADAVICTTNILAEKVKPYNSNVHVIPNAIPFGHDQFNDKKEYSPFHKSGKKFVRFIYAGGGSHFWDLKLLSVPFTKINNNPQLNNTQFILAGFDDSNEESKKNWEVIENKFDLKGTLKNYIRKNTLPLESYINHYINGDVSLIPLEYNNFNRFKSNLKIIEAGCKYMPVICSDVEPYSNESNRDVIMYAKNANEWYEHIKYCTLNPSFIEDKGKQLGEYVRKNYDLFKVNEYRKQLFEHLIK